MEKKDPPPVMTPRNPKENAFSLSLSLPPSLPRSLARSLCKSFSPLPSPPLPLCPPPTRLSRQIWERTSERGEGGGRESQTAGRKLSDGLREKGSGKKDATLSTVLVRTSMSISLTEKERGLSRKQKVTENCRYGVSDFSSPAACRSPRCVRR